MDSESVRVPVAVEPSVPAKGNVAVKWSGVIATLIAFLAALKLAVADDGISLQEWVNIAETTLLGAAAGFGLGAFAPTRK